MNTATTRAAQLYRLLVKLYPREFQADFGDEMVDVFLARLHAAAGHGVPAVFSLSLHEGRGLLTSLIREYGAHWSERQRA